MPEQIEHLDLLADAIMKKMEPLCGTAVREKIHPSEVLEICGVERLIYPDADDPLNLKGIQYAGSLMDAVFQHMASRWSQLRMIERRLHSAAVPTYDEESDFD